MVHTARQWRRSARGRIQRRRLRGGQLRNRVSRRDAGRTARQRQLDPRELGHAAAGRRPLRRCADRVAPGAPHAGIRARARVARNHLAVGRHHENSHREQRRCDLRRRRRLRQPRHRRALVPAEQDPRRQHQLHVRLRQADQRHRHRQCRRSRAGDQRNDRLGRHYPSRQRVDAAVDRKQVGRPGNRHGLDVGDGQRQWRLAAHGHRRRAHGFDRL